MAWLEIGLQIETLNGQALGSVAADASGPRTANVTISPGTYRFRFIVCNNSDETAQNVVVVDNIQGFADVTSKGAYSPFFCEYESFREVYVGANATFSISGSADNAPPTQLASLRLAVSQPSTGNPSLRVCQDFLNPSSGATLARSCATPSSEGNASVSVQPGSYPVRITISNTGTGRAEDVVIYEDSPGGATVIGGLDPNETYSYTYTVSLSSNRFLGAQAQAANAQATQVAWISVTVLQPQARLQACIEIQNMAGTALGSVCATTASGGRIGLSLTPGTYRAVMHLCATENDALNAVLFDNVQGIADQTSMGTIPAGTCNPAERTFTVAGNAQLTVQARADNAPQTRAAIVDIVITETAHLQVAMQLETLAGLVLASVLADEGLGAARSIEVPPGDYRVRLIVCATTSVNAQGVALIDNIQGFEARTNMGALGGNSCDGGSVRAVSLASGQAFDWYLYAFADNAMATQFAQLAVSAQVTAGQTTLAISLEPSGQITVPAGTWVDFTATISNIGSVTAVNVQAEVVLNDQVIRFESLGDIPPGQSRQFTFQVQAPSDGSPMVIPELITLGA